MLAYLHIKGCSLKKSWEELLIVRNRGRGLEQLRALQVAVEGSRMLTSGHLCDIFELKVCVETRLDS